MKKKILGIIVIVCIILLGMYLFTGKHTNYQKGKTYAWSTLPPALPLAHARNEKNSNTRQYSFPAFNISFQVPSTLKTMKELDPTSEDTLIGADNLTLFTPNSVIKAKMHMQTAGAKLLIKFVTTPVEFADRADVVPTNIDNVQSDDSIIPANNSLLNKNNIRVTLFPLDTSGHIWAYFVEALINKRGKMTFYCVDYSYDQNSQTCHRLLTQILPTVH